jgi:CheY-like chemotaxis protein
MSKVLIAEDNPVNRELLRELLETHGYSVSEACNGQEALNLLEEFQPDILLLDLDMPVLDGFATVRRIRENSSLASLPVLAVTAYAMQGDRERVLTSGFDGYLSKPIQSRLLFEEMDRLLGKASTRENPAAKHAGAGNG